MFYRIYLYDIRKGLLTDYKKAGIVVAVCAAFCIQFIQMRLNANLDFSTASFGDVIFFGLSGMEKYKFAADKPFVFPALWTIITVLPMFFVLYYPYYDLLGFGKNVLIQVKSRKVWWLSKCAWVTSYIIAYFLIVYSVAFAISLFMGFSLSTEITKATYDMVVISSAEENINMGSNLVSFTGSMNLQLFVLPALTLITLGLLQMMISLVTSPIYSFLISSGILISSAYYMNPFLIGNYCMVQRSNLILADGMNFEVGVVILCGISLFSVLAGMIIFERREILSKALADE